MVSALRAESFGRKSPKAISALTQYDYTDLGLAVKFSIIQIRLGEFVPLSTLNS